MTEIIVLKAEDLKQLKDDIVKEVVSGLKPLLSNKDNGKGGDTLLSVEGLAEYLCVEKDWVYSHVKEIPHSKVGRFPRFCKKDVDRWLEAQRAPVFPGTPYSKTFKLDRRPLDL